VSDFETNWVDWDGTIDIRPRTVFTPTSPSGIAKVIMTANQQNRRVRACGSGWSFSDVAVSHDYIAELSGLASTLALSSPGQIWGHTPPGGSVPNPPRSVTLGPPSALMPLTAASGRRFAHVLGGMVLRDLIVALNSPNLDSLAPVPPGAVGAADDKRQRRPDPRRSGLHHPGPGLGEPPTADRSLGCGVSAPARSALYSCPPADGRSPAAGLSPVNPAGRSDLLCATR
jgi:hypothetical protein